MDYFLTPQPLPHVEGWLWILPLAAAAIQGVRNAVEQRRAQKKANEQNMLMADKEFAQNKQMWELQNKYNDPAAQMQRLGGAGLNPNLVYGSGNAAGNQSAPGPRYNAPTAIPEYGQLNLPDMLSQYQDFQMKNAQIDNVKAQTDLTRENVTSAPIARLLKDIQGQAGQVKLDLSKGMAPYQQSIVESQAKKAGTDVQISAQNLRNLKQDELLKLIVAQQKRQQMSMVEIEKEKKLAELIYQRGRNEYQKQGINFEKDNLMFRMMARMIRESGLGDGLEWKDVLPDPKNWLGKGIRKWWNK